MTSVLVVESASTNLRGITLALGGGAGGEIQASLARAAVGGLTGCRR